MATAVVEHNRGTIVDHVGDMADDWLVVGETEVIRPIEVEGTGVGFDRKRRRHEIEVIF